MKSLLNLLVWLLRLAVFVALFGLAVKNSGPVELRFYFDQVWLAPVSVVLLATFALGILVGLTAWLGFSVRHKSR